ncbi:MAG: sugar phosphate isomerase/epimerase family protein [Saprospiraceae bacterium]
MTSTRRNFLLKSSQLALGVGLIGCQTKNNSDEDNSSEQLNSEAPSNENNALFFKISLAQWSLHRTLKEGKMDNLDFAVKARNDFGIEAVEYVNQFFEDKAKDTNYLGQMKSIASDNGVESLLIMVDGEGNLGDTDDKKRKQAVENHYKWVEAAKFLGCHSIRVNAFGQGSALDVAIAAVDGLGSLATFAKDFDINVIVENHGGYSSDADWMMNVMRKISMDNCGMLPDFGNFCIERDSGKQWEGKCINEFDRYKGVEMFMPLAKSVSAKSHDFDENGNETHTDYSKMLKIVKNAGYSGYIGVEYEGSELSEYEGIKATKALLEKIGKELG